MNATVAPAAVEKFMELVRVMRAYHEAENALPKTPDQAFEEIDDAATMLRANFDDFDSLEAMLQNAAAMVGAAQRFAAVVLTMLPAEKVDRIILENSL